MRVRTGAKEPQETEVQERRNQSEGCGLPGNREMEPQAGPWDLQGEGGESCGHSDLAEGFRAQRGEVGPVCSHSGSRSLPEAGREEKSQDKYVGTSVGGSCQSVSFLSGLKFHHHCFWRLTLSNQRGRCYLKCPSASLPGVGLRGRLVEEGPRKRMSAS